MKKAWILLAVLLLAGCQSEFEECYQKAREAGYSKGRSVMMCSPGGGK